MTLLELAVTIIGAIISLGVLIAGLGYGYGQFFKGRDLKTKEDYDLLDTRITTLQKLCDTQQLELNGHQTEIRNLRQEIGRLQGVNEEKEKKIQELTALLQNRDPQLSDFIKYSREANVEWQKIADNIFKAIRELKDIVVQTKA